jgi:hypothetical protein
MIGGHDGTSGLSVGTQPCDIPELITAQQLKEATALYTNISYEVTLSTTKQYFKNLLFDQMQSGNKCLSGYFFCASYANLNNRQKLADAIEDWLKEAGYNVGLTFKPQDHNLYYDIKWAA